MSKKNEAIARIQTGLKCTPQEALEIYKSDCAIDRGERTEFDLPQSKLNVARQYSRTGTRKTPTTYSFNKREKKENATKAGIIAELAQFLADSSENAVTNLEVTNKERQIRFTIGENTFELTLVQKRKSK